MVFQAFIDESEDQTGRTDIIVLAGHIATTEAWAEFSKEWERMLPYATLDKSGYEFKMAEMAKSRERMERVPAFYWILEKYVSVSIGAIVKKDVIDRAMARIWVPGLEIDPALYGNPYILAWRALLDTFHISRVDGLEGVLPLDQKVDFIFDEKSEKAHIVPFWKQYVADKKPEISRLYGAVPRFEDSKKVLPLQAADLWAWWLRHWAEQGELWRLNGLDFGFWKGKRDYPRLTGILSVDDVVRSLIEVTRRAIEPARRVYDLGNLNWYEPEWPLGPVLSDLSYRHIRR